MSLIVEPDSITSETLVLLDVANLGRVIDAAAVDVVAVAEIAEGHAVRVTIGSDRRQDDPARLAVEEVVEGFGSSDSAIGSAEGFVEQELKFLGMHGGRTGGRRTRLVTAHPVDVVGLTVSLVQPTLDRVPRTHVLGLFLDPEDFLRVLEGFELAGNGGEGHG